MINFDSEFRKSKGQPFTQNGTTYRLAFNINTSNLSILTLHFQLARPPYRQGVRVESNQPLRIHNDESQAFVLWQDTAPPEVKCDCSNAESIQICNTWDTGDGTIHSWHSGAAMIVENTDVNQWTFRCNDGQLDDECDDSLFLIRAE